MIGKCLNVEYDTTYCIVFPHRTAVNNQSVTDCDLVIPMGATKKFG